MRVIACVSGSKVRQDAKKAERGYCNGDRERCLRLSVLLISGKEEKSRTFLPSVAAVVVDKAGRKEQGQCRQVQARQVLR